MVYYFNKFNKMRKSTIWLLTIVMAITFSALMYFQLMYLNNMVRMRNEQFMEGVKRSLYAVAGYLEREETLHYLEKDISSIENSFYNEYNYDKGQNESILRYSIERPDGTVTNYTISSSSEKSDTDKSQLNFPSAAQGIGSRYQTMQEVIRGQYLYQKGLLNEVILTILRESGSRPVLERADSTMIRDFLSIVLSNNGLNLPFTFAVKTEKGVNVYETSGFDESEPQDVYSQILFPNSQTKYYLDIYFPTKDSYIYSSVKFLIPTLTFTIVLLIVFIYTIVVAFRQKKLTEIKTDFINNMTHEFKTPISTISLAAQMLNDDSVRKSTTMLQHISQVINDESKRLRFQVEKVLQLSMFEKQRATFKLTSLAANNVISNVVNTFKIKVEKYGGCIESKLDAQCDNVLVDEMHFTNVIFNLLDKAFKYKREDVDLHLEVSTKVTSDDRIEISIKDNGIGIKKDDLKHIFEKFYRVPTGNRHDVKGFGLGLAYVKKMVEEFKGKIMVDSEFGEGTTFVISLPLIKED